MMAYQVHSSINTLAKSCLGTFYKLGRCLLDRTERNSSGITTSTISAAELDDIFSRFKLWAGNLGALHDSRLPTSLAHRLREAPHIQDEFQALLQDLVSNIEDRE